MISISMSNNQENGEAGATNEDDYEEYGEHYAEYDRSSSSIKKVNSKINQWLKKFGRENGGLLGWLSC